MKKKVFQRDENRRQRRKRSTLVGLLFVGGFSLMAYRALYLHLANDPKLVRRAKTQYSAKLSSHPPRGAIYDSQGEELAVSVPNYSVVLHPSFIKDEDSSRVVNQLARLLDLPEREVREKTKSDKKYVWLKRNVSPQEKESLSALNLPSIELVKGTRRFYPNKEVASQILGAVGWDNGGLGGVELLYNRYLKGAPEKSMAYRDARGKTYETEETLSDEKVEEPAHIYLTLRKNIQYVAEKELTEACRSSQAKSCTAIAMEVPSGDVLAMASYPSFNPNIYESSDLSRWKNIAVTDSFEPGSTFKVILSAAALESGLVKPADKFFCENGAYRIGTHVIHDHERYGVLSFREILKVSSNIGIYKIGSKIGRKNFSQIIDAFGFGRKTGIDYPGEVSGYVPPFKSWKEVQFANMSFGQGVRVTPIQIASSFATIANGGRKIFPRLISKIVDSQGNKISQPPRGEATEILRPENARMLLNMMREVTEEGGTATRAALPGYAVAGKTGTAQKVVGGRYSHTKFVSSFVGIVPAEAPRLVILVYVDEPKGTVYGGLVAAPVFKKIAWASLMDLGIPSGQPQEKKTSSPVLANLLDLPDNKSVSHGLAVPDLLGLSKRKVLALLEIKGIRSELVGSGIVVSQQPLPGSDLKSGEGMKVFFQPE